MFVEQMNLDTNFKRHFAIYLNIFLSLLCEGMISVLMNSIQKCLDLWSEVNVMQVPSS